MKAIQLITLVCFLWAPLASGQAGGGSLPLINPKGELPKALTQTEFTQMVQAVDKGLRALSQMQNEDGSFGEVAYAKPAVTSFSVMAFLSRGHKPGEGPYGKAIEKAVKYVLASQKKSGIFADQEVEFANINLTMPNEKPLLWTYTSKSYCHGICLLMLGEVYGLRASEDNFAVKNGIEKGLKFTLRLWDIRKSPSSYDDGGFRYVRPHSDRVEADLSVTAWHLTSLRSLQNAGFEIPRELINRIIDYVKRCHREGGGFGYSPTRSATCTMSAAGSLCMALSGQHEDLRLKNSADFLIRNSTLGVLYGEKYPYYCCYYMTQNAIQMGGRLWLNQMKLCYRFLMEQQTPSGSFKRIQRGLYYSEAYSTSLALIAIMPTLKMLPIYQR